MRPLVTPEEMAAADKAAVASGTLVEVLMDRAGRAVARTAIRMMGGRYGRKVVVVCGKGNNDGDGYAAARVLRREGVGVRCMALADPSELKGAAREHYEKARAAGVPVGAFDPERLSCDLVIDAIYGTGLTSRPEGVPDDYLRVIQTLGYDRGSALVLAVDIPSGINGDSGPIMSPVRADVTVTFGAEKVGTFLAGPEFVGEVEVADIGISCSGTIEVLERTDVIQFMPHRRVDSHKRSSGSMLVIAGSDAMPGAAALVARGAMRSGCGYVTVACTEKVGDVVHELCPEALVRVVTTDDHLSTASLESLGDVLDRATVVAAGPGLGTGDDQKALVRALVQDVDLPLVLDADGLNALSGSIDDLNGRKEATVITPHPAELARLMEADVRDLDDRVKAARAAARRSQADVVLKGFRTVIVGPSDDPVVFVSAEEFERLRGPGDKVGKSDGALLNTYLNPTGGPELATAGTGDVLTGVVATFLTGSPNQRFTESVASAVYVHGLAGSLAASGEDDTGVVAWDVAEALPEAMDLIREGAA